MGMGAHMVMTTRVRKLRRTSSARTTCWTRCAARWSKYHDYRVALSEDYEIFLPTVPQDVYHFTDYRAAQQEYTGHFDPAHPGSLLYVKTTSGDYVLVGAMYSAPADYTYDSARRDDSAERRALACAHQHLPAQRRHARRHPARRRRRGASSTCPACCRCRRVRRRPAINQRLGFLADGRFGFTGKIADATECKAAGGHMLKQAFGWMVHVYPFNGDDLKVAFGMTVPKPPPTDL